jgi:hypothetical protein
MCKGKGEKKSPEAKSQNDGRTLHTEGKCY